MDGLFPCRALRSFGPNHLDPFCDAPTLIRISCVRRSGLRAQVRQQCLRRPGVYGMLNGQGELLYVGKAKWLRTRLLSYFRAKSHDPKAGRILGHTKAIVWEYAASEFAALLRELELIRRWRPRLNVQGQPGRRRPAYVCLGRQPAPYAFLTRQPPAAALAAFGPIPAGRRAREAMRYLNDCFRLRDCLQSQEMIFAEQTELFPIARAAGCLRYEIGTCLGPCVGACARIEYVHQVRAARSFLAGTDLDLLKALQRAMAEASAILAFERAAALRDKWQALHWLHECLERVRLATAPCAFVYPVEGYGGQNVWYVINAGRVVACMAAPQAAQDSEVAAQLMASIVRDNGVPIKRVPAQEIESVLLVAAWFRRHPEERSRIIPADSAFDGCKTPK